MQICSSTLYSNLSSIGMGLTNAVTDRGLKRTSHRYLRLWTPYVCGLGINQTYRRVVFEVGASLALTNLPMYSKNLVISLLNVPSNYITNFAAFSARSLTLDNEKNNGKPILVCEHCKKQWYTKDQCWKLHNRPPRGNKRSSNEQQNFGHINVREIASTLCQLALLLARPVLLL